MWLQDRSCTEQVQLAFEVDTAGSPSFTLCNKLKQCQKNLKWWNKNIFGHLDTKMQATKHKLEQVQYEILSQVDPGDVLFADEHTQIQRYNDLLVQQATHWGQKSCSDWEGNSSADCFASHAASLASSDTRRAHLVAENTSWSLDDLSFLPPFSSVWLHRPPVFAASVLAFDAWGFCTYRLINK
ncbi:hypothetical protein IFM89_003020 [Coptis chinensis]|uniref:Uncharacterized protein n=1 Tax=Coptis chinensis TaxID=261450 RepID=A0A835ITM3_9MAGN|nr:hypothetical protein IFM89_003020 [Coptis chinensis]